MAEFAYNNGYQESTKRTPFFANYGVNPEYQTIRHLMQGKITPTEEMSQLHDTLQAEMMEPQLRHKEYYDAGIVFVTGPGPIPRPAPLNGPGRGVLF